MTGEAEVLFEVRGRAGVITLNRPKALNALTLGMVALMHPQLNAWARDPAVERVVVTGAGEKAFCAGGDIRALYDSGKAGGDYPITFYGREYRLNAAIKHFPKPYVALLNGITMGGGVGVSLHGSHRIVCEASVFAMPETGIGLFPDVGGTFFLPRLPGGWGLYLAMTGARLKAADMLALGLADAFVPQARFPDLIAALCSEGESVDAIVKGFAGDAGPAPLQAHRAAIGRYFVAGPVEAIVASLRGDADSFAQDALKAMLAKSPTSMKVAARQLAEGAKRDFDACMQLEYRLANRFVAGHDFYEGVRALIVDKDNAPKWRPDTLEGVSDADVVAYFAPLASGDLGLSG